MDLYHVLEMIGEGSFGRVYKGRKKFSGQVVALKFIPKVGRSEKELRSLKREIDIMRGLKHPNIVLLLDSFETEREVVVVTEYAEGELFQILEDDGSLPESQLLTPLAHSAQGNPYGAEVREIACQLVSALYYLHSHRILHRDMKPQNILLGKGGVVKLCDFGFARAMSVSTLVLTSIKGTPLYMSPELVEEKPYDHTADLWSLGCILYELHTGAPPFYTNSIFQLVQLIVRDPVKWPDSMGQACTSFLKGLLTKDPQKRLSWPDLLQHPFVADGVVVLTDEGWTSPLTVMPSPDVQALRQQQAAEKTVPRSGEGKLLRKAREDRDKDTRSRQDQKGNGKAVQSSQACSKTAPARKAPTSDCPLAASYFTDQNSSQPTTNQHQANDTYVPRVHSAPGRGQISRDYEREFPSVEVGPRQVLKRSGVARASLASVRMDSEEIDSDEEWQQLAQVTDWANQTSVSLDTTILPRLKGKLLTSKGQLLDGILEGAYQIRQPLGVLSNLIVTSDPGDARKVAQEVGLPHFLFDLIEEILGSPVVVKQPWSVPLLGELMRVLLVYWERNSDWETADTRLEDLSKPFGRILLRPDPNPLAPLAASILTLFTHSGVSVDVGMSRLTAMLEYLLVHPEEPYHLLPSSWGLCDGLLSLILYTLSECENSPLSWFLDSELWRHLWAKVGTSLEKTPSKEDFLSLNGLYVLLSLALFVSSREPYSCVPLFTDGTTNCVLTLGHLLTADCSAVLESSLFWGDSGMNSLSVMSCHLLSFPLALELSQDKMAAILQAYHSSSIVSGLVQVIQSLPPALLELPLSLLCRLLLNDPRRAVPCFTLAAWACRLFCPQGEEARGRTEQPGGSGVQPASKAEQSQRNGDQPKSNTDQSTLHTDQSKGKVDHTRGTLNQPKRKTSQFRGQKCRGRKDQLRAGKDPLKSGAEQLRDGLDQHSGHVAQLLDSLDLGGDSANQLVDSLEWPRSITDQPGDQTDQDGDQLRASEVKGQPPEPRSASSLLSELLASASLSGSAAELLSLLSQAARCSLRPSLALDPALLRRALRHGDAGVRAAACSLLGRLEPSAGPDPGRSLRPPLLRELAACLGDPAAAVRGRACRAVGSWLGLLALAGLAPETPGAARCPREEAASERGDGGEGWVEAAAAAAPPLVALLADPDALTRQHSCVALGNLAAIAGAEAALLSAGAPRPLLHMACAHSQHDVRRAAITALCAFSQQDTLQQALKSMEAGEKLRHASQNAPLQCDYRQLLNQLCSPSRGKT